MSTDWNVIFFDRLQHFLSKRGITSRKLSEQLGKNPSYINQIERGKGYPSLPMFFEICSVLGISPEEFFRESKDIPENVLLFARLSHYLDLDLQKLHLRYICEQLLLQELPPNSRKEIRAILNALSDSSDAEKD